MGNGKFGKKMDDYNERCQAAMISYIIKFKLIMPNLAQLG